MWAGPLILYGHHRGCLNNPIFPNLGLWAACWAHFMCHQELWPTIASHPFYFVNSSLGLAGGKHYQKNAIPIFRLVLQNFAIPGCFPSILFCHYPFLPLSPPGWRGIVVTVRAAGRAAAKLAEPISLKPLDGFSPFEVLWNCLGL